MDFRRKKSLSRRSPSCAAFLINLPSNTSADSQSPKYVSRGGFKLHGALEAFGVAVNNKCCLDVGSSTGGFTDCLLQHGAREVWCIDVGYGLLDYKLRKDPRVHVLERTNFRHFDPTVLGAVKPALAVVDVSFISLKLILPKLRECLAAGTEVLALVKPQFEGTPKEAPGGFVKDEPTRQAILERTRAMIEGLGFSIQSSSNSVVKGKKGNQETFLHLITR